MSVGIIKPIFTSCSCNDHFSPIAQLTLALSLEERKEAVIHGEKVTAVHFETFLITKSTDLIRDLLELSGQL